MNQWFPVQHDRHRMKHSSRAPLDVAPTVLSFSDRQPRSTETLLDSRQLGVIFAVVAVVFLGFLGKALYLQAFEGDRYRAIAEQNRTRTLVTPAVRGVIYDDHGVQLVQNAPAFTLIVRPSELPQDKEQRLATIETAAQMVDISPTDIDLAIANEPHTQSQAIPVDIPIPYEAALRLYLEEETLPGIAVELLTTRHYEQGVLNTISHVLGYTGFISPEEYRERRDEGYRRTDKIGKQGIEAVYEKMLRGTHGARTVEVDALGREVLLIRKEDPTAGTNLHLTLDAELTNMIEERLLEYMDRAGEHQASVVVLDPRNGAVRALVSVPSYDSNLFAQGISSETYRTLLEDPRHPLFPRATSGEFPPGSTFKPTVAAIALEDGLINPRTSFLSSGGIQVSQWFFPDWKAGGHGTTNVTKAIAESVNTFFYIIGGGLGDVRGLGIERIADQARKFGFGSATGIDLPQESEGFLPSKAWKKEVKGERWYIGDTYHAAIGQGDVLVTPIQMAVATSVFANGGTLYEPHLLKEVQEVDRVVPHEPTVRTDHVMTPETIATIRQGMRQTVTEGSARSLSILPEAVAGKTGTAQAGGDRENHSWFTSFGPYEDPEIVVTVLVEEGGEGSAVASPIAKDIYSWWFANR